MSAICSTTLTSGIPDVTVGVGEPENAVHSVSPPAGLQHDLYLHAAVNGMTMCPPAGCGDTAANTGLRALYACASLLAGALAFAGLLQQRYSRRSVCAVIAEPEI